MGSVLLFLYQKVVVFVKFICFSLYKLVLALFGSNLFRREEGSIKEKSESWEIYSKIETESKPKRDFGNFKDGFAEKEETGICFQFKFPSYDDFCKKKNDYGENSISEPVEVLSGFIKEPDFQEITDENDEPDCEGINDKALSIDENYLQISSEEIIELPKETKEREYPGEEPVSSPLGPFANRSNYSSSDGFSSDDDFGDECEFESEHDLLDETPKVDENEKDLVDEEQMYSIEELRKIEEDHYKIIGKSKSEFLSGENICGESENDSEKAYLNQPELVKPQKNKDYSGNVEEIYTIEELRKIEEAHYKVVGKLNSKFPSGKNICAETENDSEKAYLKNQPELVKPQKNKDYSVNVEETYTIEELRKIEEAHYKNIGKLKSDFLSDKDFCGEGEIDSKKADTMNMSKSVTLDENANNSHIDDKDFHYKSISNDKSEFLSEKDFLDEKDSEKADTENESEWDSDELWEHQELIEQLKMELKKAKATGLPTILEESESPKIADDLKPWKIDEKYQHADRSGVLQKFYKTYADRMRKLDILNYQKMYAIGFLQLKDPLQSISPQKYSIPSVSMLLTHNLFPSKCKRIGNDPMLKFIVELQSDLEIVYVGHTCLSWEILHWQYGKAVELWETDSHCMRMYNEVAGDFQQFQVLLQRFIEDEPFQGPRVQNYVKSRCAFRNLLQVPLIKEDNLKNKRKALKRREMGDFAITSDTLVEILEESIRIFWRFVRADKDCSNVMVKSRKGIHIQLQDPADSELLLEVHANLQKKEKKLKDILRGGNCILKKFKKCEEDETDQVLYFFSQVDMKLVGRVLNMPRITTDQLIWCRNKLDKISFVSKKIQVEPSFLLFPC